MENIITFIHYFFSFIIIISTIVFIHEWGHYFVAKKCGVKIDVFSIGFGPELFGWNDKSGTRWRVAAVPLGGYVKMFGDSNEASTPDKNKLEKMTAAEKKQAFQFKTLPQKAAIVAAGPASNYILAILILTFFFSVFGKPHTVPEISNVKENSAAEQAGLQTGDVVTSLDGKEIARFEDIRSVVGLQPDKEMELVFKRGDEEITTKIKPQLSETTDVFGNKVRVGLIGISSSKVEYRDLNIFSAAGAAVYESYDISVKTLTAIGQIITGKRNSDEISGILRIGQYSGQATERGVETVLWFMALLSINLGLVNLFPVPLLDGGHLMYYTVEAMKGRPMAEKYQQFGFRVGFIILIALMIFATFNDLKHFNIF